MRYWEQVDLDEHIEFFILPTEVLRDIYHDFSELIGEKLTQIILFQCGYRSGHSIAKRMNLEYTNPESLEHLLPSLCLQFGLGFFEVQSATDNNIVLVCQDSKESMAMGKTGQPSCWMTAGYISGIVSWLTERRYRCTERTCLSAGAPQCTFELHR